MKKIIIVTLLCVFLLPFLTVNKTGAVSGWRVAECNRIDINANHGFAYLELTGAGPDAGVFSNVVFQIYEPIRNEGLAAALTSYSMGELVRVNISTETNSYGYQILMAIYTYHP
jgi:hypothetical protein